MGSVTPAMLGQSSGSVASDSASGGDLAPAIVGSVISSASGIDEPGAPMGTVARKGLGGKRKSNNASQVVLQENNIIRVG
jgi:hypothetical protein